MAKDTETNQGIPLEKKYYNLVVIIGIITAILVACMPLMGEPGVADPKTAETGGLWVNFMGHYHPLILHLPIGALMLVFCMEGLSLLTGGKYKARTTLAVGFAAVTAVVAVVLGYFWYLTGKFNSDSMDAHKRDGIIFTVLIIVTFLVKYSAHVKGWKMTKLGYFPLLGLSGVAMMSTGHHGGEMSHGDPFKQFPGKIIADRKAKDSKPVVTDPVIYTHIVHPILENKCISCHGEDKQKGDLRLDSMAAMIEGGSDEICLEPGDVKESFMLTSIDLPEDHDLHMPPKSKPQITPEEKQILIWWIAMGAPAETKLSELKVVPAEITAAIATLKTPEELEAERKQLREEKERLLADMKANRKRLQKSWEEINAKFPGSLRYASQEDTDLTFSTVSYRKSFTESDLAILKDVAGDVVELDLSSTVLTDNGVNQLKGFSKLKNLKLNETKITNEALKTIAEMKSLEKLNLYGTEVSDAGIKMIQSLPSLEKVYLWNTKVTPAGAKELQDALNNKAAANKGEDSKKRSPKVLLGIPAKK